MPMTRSRVSDPFSIASLQQPHISHRQLDHHGELAKANTSTKGIWRHVYVRYYILEKSSFFQSLVGRILSSRRRNCRIGPSSRKRTESLRSLMYTNKRGKQKSASSHACRGMSESLYGLPTRNCYLQTSFISPRGSQLSVHHHIFYA